MTMAVRSRVFGRIPDDAAGSVWTDGIVLEASAEAVISLSGWRGPRYHDSERLRWVQRLPAYD
jgi:hypothetical protein